MWKAGEQSAVPLNSNSVKKKIIIRKGKQIGIYAGEVKDDLPEGEGVMNFANRDRYSGHWTAGKIDGKGTMNYANGDRFVGQWRRNEYKDGHGNMTSEIEEVDGEGVVQTQKGDYHGQFKNGKRHGEGAFTYGKITYRGNWVKGVKAGKGTLLRTTDNTVIFKGEWENN